ncbi:MAG: hypothetical protein HY543_04530 [Deltaproteobacteria bacterium]|nr:hypothetical protein [Deltaproteobacteria bacterium]
MKSMTRNLLMMAGIAVLAACSDGAAPTIGEGEKTPSISAPQITFTVAKIGSADAKSSVAIQPGEGVDLSWTITGATRAVLKSASALLAEHEIDPAQGKETVPSLAADETFTLTAFNQDASETAVVSVSVASKPEVRIIKFEAQPKTIEPKQPTRLCFTVTPANADVAVTDPSGKELSLEAATHQTGEVLAPVPPSEDEPAGIAADGLVTFAIMAKSLNLPPPGRGAEEGAAPAEGPVAPSMPKPLPETPAPVEVPSETVGPTLSAVREGCTVEQYPEADTQYKLVASLDGMTDEEYTTVEVAQGLTIERFVAKDQNGVELTQPLPAPGMVTLEWTVVPADATVTISPAIDGETDLTKYTVGGTGSKSVQVAADMTYTLTATKGDESSEPKTVTITLKKATVASVNLVMPTNRLSLFAGEAIALTINAVGADGQPFTDASKVKVIGPDGSVVMQGSLSAPLTPMQSGNYYAEADGVKSTPITISVRDWGSALGSDAGQWTAVAPSMSSGHALLAGSASAMQIDAKKMPKPMALIAQKGDGEELQSVTVDYAKLFGGIAGKATVNLYRLANFGPYIVNAFAVDPEKDEGKRVYAAMTGAVVMSQDGGATFKKVVDVFPLVDGKGAFRDKAEEHASCKGRTQKGTSSADTDLVNLQQVCDVVVSRDGSNAERLIVATDFGVFYVDDVDRLMKDRSKVENGWKGLPRAGEKFSPTGNLFGLTVHDLELVQSGGAATLFAATDHGVFTSAQRGEKDSWQPLHGGALGTFDMATRQGDAKAVYAVAVDMAHDKLYAGTADGVYERSLGLVSGEWKKSGALAGAAPPAMPADESADGGAADAGLSGEAKAAEAAPAEAGATCPACVYSLDIADDGAVLAATGSGVFISRDLGATFINVSSSMNAASGSAVFSIAAAADGAYLAATAGGVFISEVPGGAAPPPVTGSDLPLPGDTTIPTIDGAAPAGETGQPADAAPPAGSSPLPSGAAAAAGMIL